MRQLFLITTRWVKTPITAALLQTVDNILTGHGEWIRFHGQTWFVWTESSLSKVASDIRPLVQAEDSLLVLPVDPIQFDGWAPKWVWEWLDDKRRQKIGTYPTGLFGGLPSQLPPPKK